MGLYELQFKRDAFLSMMRARLNDIPLPIGEVPNFPGRWLDRLVCTAVEIRNRDEAPADANIPVGELALRATIEVHHTTYEDARQAGSLNRPATAVATLHLWFAFSATRASLSILPRIAEIDGTSLDGPDLLVEPVIVPWPGI
ncbi:hypothetical protein GCM10023237_00110 [Streptomyces coeruleoprunus]|uniref:hypothetical protein n=1 Tax=Streptomyces coeruleoprunus TaxID=285563 RepID=UPI0031F01D21